MENGGRGGKTKQENVDACCTWVRGSDDRYGELAVMLMLYTTSLTHTSRQIYKQDKSNPGDEKQNTHLSFILAVFVLHFHKSR